MDIALPFVSVVVGKAGSGKSNLTRYLMYNQQCREFYNRFEIILVFCKTKFNHSYDFVPDEWLHGGYNRKAIKNIMKVQSNIREQGLKPLPVLLVFDDCLNPGSFKSSLFLDLIANRRHFNISVIMNTQYLNTQVPTLLRENTDLIFLFKQFSEPSLKGAFSAFGSLSFDSYYEFQRYMKRLKKYQFVKIDTRTDNFNEMKSIATTPIMDNVTPDIDYLAEIPIEVLQEC